MVWKLVWIDLEIGLSLVWVWLGLVRYCLVWFGIGLVLVWCWYWLLLIWYWLVLAKIHGYQSH
jgi:hypothetical protein